MFLVSLAVYEIQHLLNWAVRGCSTVWERGEAIVYSFLFTCQSVERFQGETRKQTNKGAKFYVDQHMTRYQLQSDQTAHMPKRVRAVMTSGTVM